MSKDTVASSDLWILCGRMPPGISGWPEAAYNPTHSALLTLPCHTAQHEHHHGCGLPGIQLLTVHRPPGIGGVSVTTTFTLHCPQILPAH